MVLILISCITVLDCEVSSDHSDHQHNTTCVTFLLFDRVVMTVFLNHCAIVTNDQVCRGRLSSFT